MKPVQFYLPILILLILAILSFISSMAIGTVHLSFATIFSALFHPTTPTLLLYKKILLKLRLPRATSAFVSGALLGLAGTLMQVLLRNSLADPYILGIASGASFANLLATLLGLTGIFLSGSTFVGALVTMFLVFTLSNAKGNLKSTKLLLTGIIVAAGFSAANTFILTLTSNSNLKEMLFWLIGDLNASAIPKTSSAILLIGLLISFFFARELNLLTRGELTAKALGVNTKPLRFKLYFLSSLLTAAAVTMVGPIGFIGLIIPHIVRLALGSDHRILLPASVLAGGTLLTFADIIARTLIPSTQLPVGVITTLLGVPIFLILLQKTT